MLPEFEYWRPTVIINRRHVRKNPPKVAHLPLTPDIAVVLDAEMEGTAKNGARLHLLP